MHIGLYRYVTHMNVSFCDSSPLYPTFVNKNHSLLKTDTVLPILHSVVSQFYFCCFYLRSGQNPRINVAYVACLVIRNAYNERRCTHSVTGAALKTCNSFSQSSIFIVPSLLYAGGYFTLEIALSLINPLFSYPALVLLTIFFSSNNFMHECVGKIHGPWTF